jgi:arginase family enzyme
MSKLVPIGSILVNPHDVQSPYSLRCIPQVHGPTLEMLLHIKEILEREFNSTTDNPLIFEYGTPRIISNGNFHGEYIAKALDVLAIYTHELGNISYPRIMRLLNKAKNKDLRTFLTYEEGLSSGMMTYENLAAALVSENKVHCTPASVDSISTCADKEDHVSMGGYAARKAVTVSDNVGKILTVELMAATKAIYMRKEEEVDFTIPPYLRKLYEKVIAISPPFIKDRYSKPEYDKIYEFIMSGQLWDEVLSQFDVDAEEGEISKEKNTFVPKINNNNEIYKNKMEGREPKEVKEVAKEARNSNDKKSDSLGKEIKISPIPMNEQGHLIYTKERNNQTQIGQLPNLFIKSENSISAKDISEHLKAKKNDNEKVFAILDLSQDDIGSRANFGKGHSSPNYSIIPFLEKLSNHPVNKLNINYINSILLLGSLDLSDLISQCENLDVNVKENRDILINSVGEVDRRTQQVCDKILQSGSQIICLNGDNNNTFSLIASVEKAFKKKVVLIYLDLHSDCRDTNDGPHSGTWVTQAYENGLVEKAFLVGFSELHNNEACVNNLLKNNVEFVNYTAQKIQSGLTSIKSSVEEIVNIVKYNHIGHPVVLCIDGDTVCGLPASAGNTVVGFPHFEVYPMIYKLSNELDVKAYHIAELKPSLDVSKSSAVGEFLMQATYLFLKGSLDSKKN